MATILIQNPTKKKILEFIDSRSHFLEANNIILAMSDLKRWFKYHNNLNEFLYIENGFSLCEVAKNEEVFSEEDTLITAG